MSGTAPGGESPSGPRHPASVPVGDWMRARGPFRQLRSALLDAEVLLNGYKPALACDAWQAARTAVGNDAAVIEAINDLFTILEARPRIDVTTAGPRLSLSAPRAPRELGAASAVAVLIDHSGCRRLKRCPRPGCDHIFIDWTNSNNRAACRFHPGAGHCGSHERSAPEDS